MIKLYNRNTSGNCYKIKMLLKFLNLKYSTIDINLDQGRNVIDEEYLKLNPRGQIPTLDDNGFIVWGSTAILSYLAVRYDAPRRWLPDEPQKFAEVVQWLELAQNEIASGVFRTRAIALFGYAGDLSQALIDGRRALDILESRLSHQPWLVGDQATIADIACFPYVAPAEAVGFCLAPGVRAWIKRFEALEGYEPLPSPPAAITALSK